MIATGDTTYETSVVLKFSMNSLNLSDSLTPQIEIREVGTDFTDTVTNSGSAVVYSGSPVTGTVTVSGLENGLYHWQARISNPAGNSSWASYGSNLESAADVVVSAPAVSSFSPSDGAVGVLADSSLSITFDRTVVAGTGYITIYDSGDVEFESFDVTSDVSGFGTDTITFTPSSILIPSTDYYVLVDATAVVDSGGHSFDGIVSSGTWNFTVEDKRDQTITFAALAGKTFGDSSFALAGTASSGLTVSYVSSDETVAAVVGSAVTVAGAGTTTITASQSGNVLYNSAVDAARDLVVAKADQTIDFAVLDSRIYGSPSFSLTATASSGLAVSFSSSNSLVATIDGVTVATHSTGTSTITATQTGDDDWNLATVERELSVIQDPNGGTRTAPNGGAPTAYAYFLNAPIESAVYHAGDEVALSWNTGGANVSYARMSFSADGGLTWSQIFDRQSTFGSYGWTVPNLTTDQAKLKVEATDAGDSVVASAFFSATFSVMGVSVVENENESDEVSTESDSGSVSDPNVSGIYSPQSASDSTLSIDIDLGLHPTEGEVVYCVPGSLIKTAGNSAVYYCGEDGRRYCFPNEHIYSSWFDGFDAVMIISSENLARIPLGGNVLYRPGHRMIKIQSDPRVYAVARGGLLRWVTTERVAEALYGPNWNRMIDDVDPSFFFSYTVGDPITESDFKLAEVSDG